MGKWLYFLLGMLTGIMGFVAYGITLVPEKSS
jgi:hypothetical protein